MKVSFFGFYVTFLHFMKNIHKIEQETITIWDQLKEYLILHNYLQFLKSDNFLS